MTESKNDNQDVSEKAKPQKKAGMQNLAIWGGAASILVVGLAAYLAGGKSQFDLGGSGQSTIKGQTPVARNDSMKAVGSMESDKRALVNKERADNAARDGKGMIAAPVIVTTKPAELGEMPESNDKPKEEAKQPVVKEIVRTVYVNVPSAAPVQVPTPDPVTISRVNAQIEALLTPPQGGFVNRQFAKGERPQVAQGVPTRAVPQVMIARAGDVAMARLDRGFNSDDPAAPIFATIVDLDDYNRPGPLNGARLMGHVIVNNNQASIQFDQLIWQDGQSSAMKAIAISQTDARTGVATDVDRHLLEKYGGAMLSGLMTGVGQVGQILTQNNRTVAVQPYGGYVATGNHTDWGQAAMGAMLPVGQQFTTIFMRDLNQPTTVSAPQGLTIGIVFLQPVLAPSSQTARR